MDSSETEFLQDSAAGPEAQRRAARFQLARGMGHDFNNILQGVLGAVSVVKLSTPATHQLYSILELAERSANQARELGRRLIFLAKGQATFNHTGPLGPLLRSLVETGLRGSAVTAHFDLEPEPVVRADEQAVRILVDALVSNAREAMAAGGTLTVSARPCTLEGAPGLPAGDYVRYTFRDTGPGIAAEVLPRIFELHFSTKPGKAPNGVGLSLAIAEAIAWAHGGELSAESTPGQGAAFHLLLPVHLA